MSIAKPKQIIRATDYNPTEGEFSLNAEQMARQTIVSTIESQIEHDEDGNAITSIHNAKHEANKRTPEELKAIRMKNLQRGRTKQEDNVLTRKELSQKAAHDLVSLFAKRVTTLESTLNWLEKNDPPKYAQVLLMMAKFATPTLSAQAVQLSADENNSIEAVLALRLKGDK